MEKVRAYLKRFVELATRWLNKLRYDLHFRTEFIIIGILFFLCFANVIIVTISLRYLHTEVVAVVVSTVTESLNAVMMGTLNPTTTSAVLIEELGTIRDTNLIAVTGVSIIFTIIFGYVVARIALTPTRHALASQKQFIANVAHELRTPLAIIKANSEILLLKKEDNSDSRAMIKSNIEELDRISGIINNLLTLNAFRHVDHMNFQVVNLSEIIRSAILKFDDLAKSKNITLNASGVTDELYIWGNNSGIAQIVTNLVKNALMYTPHKGTVTVFGRRSSNVSTEIEVRDTGIGIEQDKLRRIFEPFYQVEPSRTRNRGSSGLGLAIVSELVKLHHGKISIQSIPRMGTTVRVEFPTQKNIKGLTSDSEDTDALNEIFMDFSRKT